MRSLITKHAEKIEFKYEDYTITHNNGIIIESPDAFIGVVGLKGERKVIGNISTPVRSVKLITYTDVIEVDGAIITFDGEISRLIRGSVTTPIDDLPTVVNDLSLSEPIYEHSIGELMIGGNKPLARTDTIRDVIKLKGETV